MPWCPACERFWSPPTVTPEGRCPECQGEVEAGRSRVMAEEENPERPGGAGAEELPPVPWHLKVIGGMAVAYLGWRLIQGIVWLVGRL